jgi:phosphomannomutase
MKKIDESIFKAYDIRGTYPDQLNEEIAGKVALAFAEKLKPKTVVVGRDLREASEKMENAVKEALVSRGVKVYDVGRMTNPMMGFAVFNYGYDGGIILSASHNPIGYGGLKMFAKNAVSIPGEDSEIKSFSLNGVPIYKGSKGSIEKINIVRDYVDYVRSVVNISGLKNKKIIFDPMFGSVNLILDKVLEGLPVEKIKIHYKADKLFGGLSEPNPYNYEMQKDALSAVRENKPDFGVMWDGDGDRVFFIDENANFIEAPYITAILSEYILKQKPGSKIVCDTRVIWPIEKAVKENGGVLIETRSGYRFIKEKMVETGSPFAAETTAHYFFQEMKNMDNGIIPLLMVWKLISDTGKTLSQLIAPYKENHYIMEEIKREVTDIGGVLAKVKDKYKNFKSHNLDGLSIISDKFRFNLRSSNTEPAIKLNMEARGSDILESEKRKLLELIK